MHIFRRQHRINTLVLFSLHYHTAAEAMDESRSVQWSNHSRRGDHKRMRDEFDHVAQDIVAKMKRELSGRLKDDADRLRRERNKVDDDNEKLRAENDRLCSLTDRLRAKCERKSAALAQLEQQLTKRFKTALEDAFEEVFAMSEGAATDPSEQDGAAPTPSEEPPANTVDNGPGNAAPSPHREGEEEEVQDQVLEQAVDCRSELTPVGGQ